jgi:hypothetical protein
MRRQDESESSQTNQPLLAHETYETMPYLCMPCNEADLSQYPHHLGVATQEDEDLCTDDMFVEGTLTHEEFDKLYQDRLGSDEQADDQTIIDDGATKGVPNSIPGLPRNNNLHRENTFNLPTHPPAPLTIHEYGHEV